MGFPFDLDVDVKTKDSFDLRSCFVLSRLVFAVFYCLGCYTMADCFWLHGWNKTVAEEVNQQG